MRFVLPFILSLSLAGPASAGEKIIDGAQLYSRHCAACHGESGYGGIGVPLALPSFQATVTDEYLRTTIVMGRPGRVMPSFRHLADHEIDAIVDHVRAWGTGSTLRGETPIAGDAARGGRLYAAHCAACHGERGEGGHGTGVTLSRARSQPIMAPALNNPGFLAAADDAMIKEILRKGREGTPMASFLERGLGERDLDDIVSFVRSFERSAGPATRPETATPVLAVDSPYDLARTVENVKAALAAQNMALIREQSLDFGLVPEAQEQRGRHVIYFCNFQMLNEALGVDPRIGLFLPFRITAVELDGKVRLLAMNPRRMAAVFNNNELDGLLTELARIYRNIMDEATL